MYDQVFGRCESSENMDCDTRPMCDCDPSTGNATNCI